MIVRSLSTCLPISLLLAAACSGGGGEDSGASDTLDAGDDALDSGVHPDAGPPDSGVPGPCNPIDGTGCATADAFCVLQIMQDLGQCRTLPAQNGFEQPCSTQLQDCAPGLACVLFTGETGPSCRKVCYNSTGTGCEGLTGASASYQCSLLPQGSTNFAFCRGAGASCVPYADTCPAGDVCSLQNRATTCVRAGTVPIGADCSQAQCARGGICINLTGSPGPRCYAPCDPAMPACTTPNTACGALQGLSFGICRSTVPNCDPLNDTCPAGQVCSLSGLSTDCRTAGTTPIGGDCTTEPCMRGGICINVTGTAGPICYEPCAVMNGTCTAGQCRDIQQPFRICIP